MSEGRSEPAAEQTLRIRFQRLCPTPSPAAVICVRGSVTLRGIKRPRGNRPSSEGQWAEGQPKTTQMVRISPAGPALGSQCLPAGLDSSAGERPGSYRKAKA